MAPINTGQKGDADTYYVSFIIPSHPQGKDCVTHPR